MPTFIELAGGTAPTEVDGASLVPILLNNASSGSNREVFLVEYYGEGEENSCGLYQCKSQHRGYDRLSGSIDSGRFNI